MLQWRTAACGREWKADGVGSGVGDGGAWRDLATVTDMTPAIPPNEEEQDRDLSLIARSLAHT